MAIRRKLGAIGGIAMLLAATLACLAPAVAAEHAGIAMYGDPALPDAFDHLPYAEPQAPKGGRLVVGVEGTFDSLNPWNLGAASTVEGLEGTVFQSLMTRSRDEPFTLYALIARTIETDAARTSVTFRLDPRARFSDGAAVTAEDVLFSFRLLKAHGRPQHRVAFAFVRAISAPDAATVHYDLTGSSDRELPLILALMPVLPAHATDVEHFDAATLVPPVGSGPYRLTRVEQGRRLVLTRDPTYWARDLPSQRGLYNFDEIAIEYFADGDALFAGFAAGLLDARIEPSAHRWMTAYGFPAMRDGTFRRESLPIGGPKGVDGFAFNLRRPVFQDIRVRRALATMLDFEWLNAKLYEGLMTRSVGFFDDSELSSVGRPAGEAERRLLARWPGAVTPEIMDGQGGPPVTDGSGEDRRPARAALAALRPLGFRLADGRLSRDGAPLDFEILVRDSSQERLALNYAASLARIGVTARVRRVDPTQYDRRRESFDFDMAIGRWHASASPGNEQRSRFGSHSADQDSSFNLAGVRSPAVDALIEIILASRTHDEFVTAVRAYDRALRSGAYIVPLFYASQEWVAVKRGLAHPTRLPQYDAPVGLTLESWWWTRS